MATEETPGVPVNKPGVYRHKAGGEFITSEGDEGVIQADALMAPHWHGQWEWVDEVPSRQEQFGRREAQTNKDIEAGNTKPEKVKAEPAETKN